MCGIVGAIAAHPISNNLLESLKRLEYRGYDSAGMAVLNDQQLLKRIRAVGKVSELARRCQAQALDGQVGIAHTRWATHGRPSESNAHPHFSANQIAVVHNGIIENFEQLRQQLRDQGYQFDSETDSEVCVHLIHYHYQQQGDLLVATQMAARQLAGAFSLGVIHEGYPDQLIAVRKGSPLVIGWETNACFIASDPIALHGYVEAISYLEEGDVARLTLDGIELFNAQGKPVERNVEAIQRLALSVDKGPYRHFMLKEIYEQPLAIADTLQGRLSEHCVYAEIFGSGAADIFEQIQCVHIVACGTSFHAGLIAKYWIESLCEIPCHVEVASEYRYRNVVIPERTLFVTVSQSGETADTLAALRKAKEQHYLATLSICNVPTSSLVRETDLVFLTRAGTEIGVASTKAFTTQLCALLLLTLAIDGDNNTQAYVQTLRQLPRLCETLLQLDGPIKQLATAFADHHHALFLGRGPQYPVAMEGALKLKEISYIHAEAYPAGELKHGPLALIDADMPVIAVAPNDKLLEKLKSNLQEVRARGGRLYVFTDNRTGLISEHGIEIIATPAVDEIIAPIAYTIPLQLLAYHVAVLKGTDVDQPRNLAKSVTVE